MGLGATLATPCHSLPLFRLLGSAWMLGEGTGWLEDCLLFLSVQGVHVLSNTGPRPCSWDITF